MRDRAACALFALLAVALFPATAFAQFVGSDTETVEARIGILEPGTMVKLQDMDFGQIAQPLAAGTVTLTPTPSPTCGTSAGIVRTGTCHAAIFAVMGRKNLLVRIREVNGGVISLTGSAGGTMTVTNLTISVTDLQSAPGGGNPAGTFGRYRITNDSGVGTFRIGGRLNVGANQTPGVYNGVLNMQVVFN